MNPNLTENKHSFLFYKWNLVEILCRSKFDKAAVLLHRYKEVEKVPIWNFFKYLRYRLNIKLLESIYTDFAIKGTWGHVIPKKAKNRHKRAYYVNKEA